MISRSELVSDVNEEPESRGRMESEGYWSMLMSRTVAHLLQKRILKLKYNIF